jgi:hypothetical protein
MGCVVVWVHIDIEFNIGIDDALRQTQPLASLVIGEERRHLALRQQAVTDPLTGLGNRSALRRQSTPRPVPSPWRSSTRRSRPPSVRPSALIQLAANGSARRLGYSRTSPRHGTVLAGVNVNAWGVTDAIQALVRSRRPVDITRSSDPDVPLADIGH